MPYRRTRIRSADPYWTQSRFDSTDVEGNPVKKGTRIFYYPSTRSVYQGAAAETAAADFAVNNEDESFVQSQFPVGRYEG